MKSAMEKIELSTELNELLNGKDLIKKQHEVMMLLTVGKDGWPHNAMISVGEIIALNHQYLRIGLWPNTATTANIIRAQKATLVLVYKGTVNYINLSLERLDELPNPLHHRERFSAKIISIREDIAKYADITSGIKIRLKNDMEVIGRWYQSHKELLK